MQNTLYPDSEPSSAAPAAPPPLYTDKFGVSYALHVSTRTVDNWKADGVIPYLLIGGIIRYDLNAIRAALEAKFLVREAPVATAKQLKNDRGTNPKSRRGRPVKGGKVAA